MKNRKALYLLIFALIVVTISFILISIWGYHYYFDSGKPQPISQNIPQDSTIAHKTSLKDSLQMLLNTTVDQLGDENDSTLNDSTVDKTLALKLIEFNRLKNEITEILRNKSSSQDMSDAGQKIEQLQQSVDELRDKNNEVAAENERLNNMVKQLMSTKGGTADKAKPSRSSKSHLASSAYTLPVLVSHLRFVAMTVNDDNEAVTNIAAKTERLSGSFQVNIKPSNTTPTIYVVVIQPNGKTLFNSAWQSGNFETQTGRKVYSALLHFDNIKDNQKRLSFTIDSHNFQKGKYIMQVYHQGIMIGKLTRTLF